MNQLNSLTATELIHLLNEDKITVEDIANSYVESIKNNEYRVRAWEYFDKEQVLNNAKKLDKRKEIKGTLGVLNGVPIGIKDIFNTHDMPTAMGSKIWDGFTPGNDARVVHYLRENDGLIFGKTVTAEFAVHFLPANKTVNPHNSNYIPGTSSSGSAAAVASNMVPLALGTQTAGSIIRPASYCGVFGFKPSFGVVPRTGSLKTTDTLDTVGCFSKSIEDIKLLFDVIRVKGTNYPYVNKCLDNLSNKNYENMNIGILFDDHWIFENYKSYAIKEFFTFLDALKYKNKVNISKIKINSDFKKIHKLHNILYNKTLSYYFKSEYKDMNKISDEIKELIEIGNSISTNTYIDALNQQELIRQNMEVELSPYDLVLTLSTAGEAPLINENEIPDTCLIWTFLGMPTLNIPLFKGPNQLPYGLQAIGVRYSDIRILDISKKILLKDEKPYIN